MKKLHNDDGRTIVNMNIPGMPWYNPNTLKDTHSETLQNKPSPLNLTKKELFAIIKAGFSVLLPIIAVFVVGYTAIMLFLHFVWLQ